MKGYCCHCGKRTTLSHVTHGRRNRYYNIGHNCPIVHKSFGRWLPKSERRLTFGMVENPFSRRKKKRFKRPDKTFQRTCQLIRSLKREEIPFEILERSQQWH